MRPLAALFDLDGTLLDTLRDIAEAANEALQSRGHPPHDLDAYRHHVGDGVRVLATRVLPPGAREDAEIDRVVEAFVQSYGRRWRDHLHPYPGITSMLDGLRGRGLRLGVVSNKPDVFTQLTVEAALDRRIFDDVRGATPDGPQKPDPTSALDAAAALGVPPAACLFCGDTSTDMRTAVAAGMVPVGVLWGYRDAAELRASGARHLLSAPEEMLDLVDRMGVRAPGAS